MADNTIATLLYDYYSTTTGDNNNNDADNAASSTTTTSSTASTTAITGTATTATTTTTTTTTTLAPESMSGGGGSGGATVATTAGVVVATVGGVVVGGQMQQLLASPDATDVLLNLVQTSTHELDAAIRKRKRAVLSESSSNDDRSSSSAVSSSASSPSPDSCTLGAGASSPSPIMMQQARPLRFIEERMPMKRMRHGSPRPGPMSPNLAIGITNLAAAAATSPPFQPRGKRGSMSPRAPSPEMMTSSMRASSPPAFFGAQQQVVAGSEYLPYQMQQQQQRPPQLSAQHQRLSSYPSSSPHSSLSAGNPLPPPPPLPQFPSSSPTAVYSSTVSPSSPHRGTFYRRTPTGSSFSSTPSPSSPPTNSSGSPPSSPPSASMYAIARQINQQQQQQRAIQYQRYQRLQQQHHQQQQQPLQQQQGELYYQQQKQQQHTSPQYQQQLTHSPPFQHARIPPSYPTYSYTQTTQQPMPYPTHSTIPQRVPTIYSSGAASADSLPSQFASYPAPRHPSEQPNNMSLAIHCLEAYHKASVFFPLPAAATTVEAVQAVVNNNNQHQLLGGGQYTVPSQDPSRRFCTFVGLAIGASLRGLKDFAAVLCKEARRQLDDLFDLTSVDGAWGLCAMSAYFCHFTGQQDRYEYFNVLASQMCKRLPIDASEIIKRWCLRNSFFAIMHETTSQKSNNTSSSTNNTERLVNDLTSLFELNAVEDEPSSSRARAQPTQQPGSRYLSIFDPTRFLSDRSIRAGPALWKEATLTIIEACKSINEIKYARISGRSSDTDREVKVLKTITRALRGLVRDLEAIDSVIMPATVSVSFQLVVAAMCTDVKRLRGKTESASVWAQKVLRLLQINRSALWYIVPQTFAFFTSVLDHLFSIRRFDLVVEMLECLTEWALIYPYMFDVVAKYKLLLHDAEAKQPPRPQVVPLVPFRLAQQQQPQQQKQYYQPQPPMMPAAKADYEKGVEEEESEDPQPQRQQQQQQHPYYSLAQQQQPQPYHHQIQHQRLLLEQEQRMQQARMQQQQQHQQPFGSFVEGVQELLESPREPNAKRLKLTSQVAAEGTSLSLMTTSSTTAVMATTPSAFAKATTAGAMTTTTTSSTSVAAAPVDFPTTWFTEEAGGPHSTAALFQQTTASMINNYNSGPTSSSSSAATNGASLLLDNLKDMPAPSSLLLDGSLTYIPTSEWMDTGFGASELWPGMTMDDHSVLPLSLSSPSSLLLHHNVSNYSSQPSFTNSTTGALDLTDEDVMSLSSGAFSTTNNNTATTTTTTTTTSSNTSTDIMNGGGGGGGGVSSSYLPFLDCNLLVGVFD